VATNLNEFYLKEGFVCRLLFFAITYNGGKHTENKIERSTEKENRREKMTTRSRHSRREGAQRKGKKELKL
jgi:hypothetical protein